MIVCIMQIIDLKGPISFSPLLGIIGIRKGFVQIKQTSAGNVQNLKIMSGKIEFLV